MAATFSDQSMARRSRNHYFYSMLMLDFRKGFLGSGPLFWCKKLKKGPFSRNGWKYQECLFLKVPFSNEFSSLYIYTYTHIHMIE